MRQYIFDRGWYVVIIVVVIVVLIGECGNG
jgi:hypothetical protein